MFKIAPEGIKTLEVEAVFPGNKQIFYSKYVVDVVGLRSIISSKSSVISQATRI